MIKRTFTLLCLIFLISAIFTAQALAKGEEFNKPIPKEAIELVKQAQALRARDKFDEAIAALKKAMTMAPNYVGAYVAYFQTKNYFMERDDEVNAELASLKAKEPNNPVYPMAQHLSYQIVSKSRDALLARVVELAPDWSWGHFAKAMIAKGSNPIATTTMAELNQCLQMESSSRRAYMELIMLQAARNDFDAAIETARKAEAYPAEYGERPGTSVLELRFKKAGRSTEEIAKLKAELERVIEAAQDADALDKLDMPLSIFRDEALREKFENKIKKLNPNWCQVCKGYSTVGLWWLPGEEDRTLAVFNQQFVIWNKAFITHINRELTPDEKLPEIEKLFALKPGRRMTELLYHYLFEQAQRGNNVAAIIKYGEALRKIIPYNVAVPTRMALTLIAHQGDLNKALAYARSADAAAAEFRAPALRRDSDPNVFQDFLTEPKLQERYNNSRAMALNALGWTLYQMGNYAEAESKLQQAVTIKRDKDNMLHWAAALAKIGKAEESAKVGLEAENLLANFVMDEMDKVRREPAKGFALQTVDGRKVSLSDLKGKVVLINFWATWCGPCIAELPDLKRLYDKYKDKGFEILAISGDDKDDRQKVIDFAKKREMNFTVLFDEGVLKQYAITGLPTSIFVDRDGNVRYRITAIGNDVPKSLEIVLNELLR